MKKYLLLTMGLALSACATSPDKIKAEYVPDTAYASLSCQQLGESELKQADTVSQLYNSQRRAHKTDTWTVLAVGVPLSGMLDEDKKEQFAREKGKLDAIHRVQATKSCPGTNNS
ncbi:hypothetical protein [Acetobacter sp. DsW_54]|uniref:hypothetical protein n=1 Tax=Acetobacter TaxID=434 RepID=UPI000A39FD9A|nr:hypothetical protein [Acetobacter sp. DsW_54]OUI98411.1 hypothetical protein HK20_06380 [Acetobacter sp. DsW_54]